MIWSIGIGVSLGVVNLFDFVGEGSDNFFGIFNSYGFVGFDGGDSWGRIFFEVGGRRRVVFYLCRFWVKIS